MGCSCSKAKAGDGLSQDKGFRAAKLSSSPSTGAKVEINARAEGALDEKERCRLDALQAVGLARQPVNQPQFTNITSLLTQLFKVPYSSVIIIEKGSGWALASTYTGKEKSLLDVVPSSKLGNILDSSFSAWTARQDKPGVLIVTDAAKDARFCAWDAHIEPSYRDLYKTGFYAGVPLVGSDGYNYGTLCVFDRQPRSFTLDMYCLLISFSELVSREIERGCHTALPQCKARWQDCLRDGVMLCNMEPTRCQILYANGGISPYEKTGNDASAVVGCCLWDILTPSLTTEAAAKTFCEEKVELGERFTMPLTSKHTKRHMLAIFKPAASELVADAAAEKCGIPSFVANPPLTAPTRRLYFVCLSEVTQPQPESVSGEAARAMPRLGDSIRPLALACGSVATVSFTAGYPGAESLQMPLPRSLKSNKIIQGVRLGPMIGRSDFCKIFRGMWKGAQVAVKVLEHVSNAGEQAPLNSVLGACLSKDLAHPNLIMTYDWATLALADALDGQAAPQSMQTLSLWIIQEYANCGSLNDVIERGDFKVTPTPNSPPNMPHVLLTAKDIAGAVSYMHGHGILHGDLTGSNVLLTSHVLGDDRGFCAKVADFKLARVIQGTDSCTTRTCGTATHCPPELIKDGSLSPAGDAWAFGILLWEMASGQRAFKGMRDAQIIAAIVRGAPQLKLGDEIPLAYKSLVERCLDKDPKQRPDFDQIVLELGNQLGTTSSLQQDKVAVC